MERGLRVNGIEGVEGGGGSCRGMRGWKGQRGDIIEGGRDQWARGKLWIHK